MMINHGFRRTQFSDNAVYVLDCTFFIFNMFDPYSPVHF